MSGAVAERSAFSANLSKPPHSPPPSAPPWRRMGAALGRADLAARPRGRVRVHRHLGRTQRPIRRGSSSLPGARCWTRWTCRWGLPLPCCMLGVVFTCAPHPPPSPSPPPPPPRHDTASPSRDTAVATMFESLKNTRNTCKPPRELMPKALPDGIRPCVAPNAHERGMGPQRRLARAPRAPPGRHHHRLL